MLAAVLVTVAELAQVPEQAVRVMAACPAQVRRRLAAGMALARPSKFRHTQ